MSDLASFVASHEGPVVRVHPGPGSRPVRAAARGRIEASPQRVWDTLFDVERFARKLPMVDHARRRGEDVQFDLKFRVGFFSAGFDFLARQTSEPGKWIAYDWKSGEPRDIHMRFTMFPIEGQPDACTVETEAGFDVQSLGWLVKYFLKHHPEIQHGIFPGITLVLLDSIRRAIAE
jgi:ribosome-associated toxin RatA of RatAB toxin-antitoxin module